MKSILLCIFVVLGAFGAALVMRRPAPMQTQTGIQPSNGVANGVARIDQAKSPSIPKEKPTGRGKENIPIEFNGFYQLQAIEQQASVNRFFDNVRLTPEVMSFMTSALHERSLSDATRNNIADILLRQDAHDSQLYQQFLSMIDDPKEGYTWREYAVEYLAGSAEFSDSPNVIIDKLKSLMVTGERSIPGTAIIHLDRLERLGLVQLDNNFSTTLMTLLGRQSTDLQTRISILGVLSGRRDSAALPIIRQIIGEEQGSVKRSAIAALGVLGGQGDADLIQSALTDSDESIKAAASAAMQRLTSRQQEQKATTELGVAHQ